MENGGRTYGYSYGAKAQEGPLWGEIAAEDVFYDDEENRPALTVLLTRLKAGDRLVLRSLDELGASPADIIGIWYRLIKKKIRILSDKMAESSLLAGISPGKILELVAKAEAAEQERIRAHQAKGIAAALKRGAKFGRQPKERGRDYPAVLAAWQAGKISSREAGAKLHVAHATFLRWAREG